MIVITRIHDIAARSCRSHYDGIHSAHDASHRRSSFGSLTGKLLGQVFDLTQRQKLGDRVRGVRPAFDEYHRRDGYQFPALLKPSPDGAR